MIPSTHDETKEAYENGTFTLPGLDSFGNYNTAPEPMVTIAAESYSHRLLHWQVLAIENRQPEILNYRVLRIHWLNTGNGIGLSRIWLPGPAGGTWTPVYWLIGCAHGNMAIAETSYCLHKHVCQDCGYTTIVDSSG